jgi:HNH endonuclease
MVALAIKVQPYCSVCGTADDLTGDHIIPISQGGLNTPTNIQVLCRSHNSAKGGTPVVEKGDSRDSHAQANFGAIRERGIRERPPSYCLMWVSDTRTRHRREEAGVLAPVGNRRLKKNGQLAVSLSGNGLSRNVSSGSGLSRPTLGFLLAVVS